MTSSAPRLLEGSGWPETTLGRYDGAGARPQWVFDAQSRQTQADRDAAALAERLGNPPLHLPRWFVEQRIDHLVGATKPRTAALRCWFTLAWIAGTSRADLRYELIGEGRVSPRELAPFVYRRPAFTNSALVRHRGGTESVAVCEQEGDEAPRPLDNSRRIPRLITELEDAGFLTRLGPQGSYRVELGKGWAYRVEEGVRHDYASLHPGDENSQVGPRLMLLGRQASDGTPVLHPWAASAKGSWYSSAAFLPDGVYEGILCGYGEPYLDPEDRLDDLLQPDPYRSIEVPGWFFTHNWVARLDAREHVVLVRLLGAGLADGRAEIARPDVGRVLPLDALQRLLKRGLIRYPPLLGSDDDPVVVRPGARWGGKPRKDPTT